MKDKHIVGGLIAMALVFAGVFCVTFTTLTQSIPLILFAVAGIVALLQSRKGIYGGNSGLKTLTVVTILYFLCRAYYSPVASLARQDMFLIAGGAMLYSMAGVLITSKVVRRWITAGFILVMILNLLNWIPAVDQWRDSILGFAEGEKNTGLFNHRNFYGNFMFMMTCLCLSLALFSVEKPIIFRVGLGLLGLCGGVSVVLSIARSSFLALALGLCVLIACYILTKGRTAGQKQRSIFVVAGVGLMLVMSVGLFIGGKVVMNDRSTVEGTKEDRGKYFALSLEQMPDAPLIGSGSRSVEYKSYEYWPMEMYHVIKDYRFVHNEFLQTVTDYGIIGFVLLFTVFIWHVINGVILIYTKSAAKQFTELAYVTAGLSIMLGLSVNMLFSFPMHGFLNVLLIVFAGTMLLGESSKKTHKEGSSRVTSVLMKPLSLVTIFVLIVYTGTEGSKEFRAGKAFWKQGLVVDDLYWTQNEETNDQWVAALSEAVAISPTYSRYNRLGEIFFARGGYEKAIEYYRLSKTMHPYSPLSRISLARLLVLKKQFVEAEKEFLEVEYLVKNREPLFYYYQNLADFYHNWASEDLESRSRLLVKSRKACEESKKKLVRLNSQHLRRSTARILLACYYDLLEQEKTTEAFAAFDEFVMISRKTPIRSKEDAARLIAGAKELLKHADLTWNRGLMERSAKATYRAKIFYHRYYRYKKKNVNQLWINEEKQISNALKMFQQAGIEIDKE